MISRFKDDEAIANTKWTNIVNFIERFGTENTDDYLAIENNFVDFLRMFYTDNSTAPQEKYGCSWLGFNIIVNDIKYNDRESYYGLKDADKRIQKLAKLNINYISKDDMTFLLKCWVRELCLLYFFEISTGSYLRATDADFCFILMLHESIKVSDIFEPVANVYISEILDPNS